MSRKPGRPKKDRADNLDETQGGGGFLDNYRGKRNYQVSISERVRELINPDLLVKYWGMILEGFNPVWLKNKKGEYYDVVPDPNPLTGSSSPAQRDAAVRELMNRGWGMAVQSIQIDAQFKTQVEPLQLQGVDLELLAKLNQLFLETSKPQLTNITDAELVVEDSSGELQEPCQVETPNDLLENSELQDACQNLGTAFAQIAELIVTTNENSPPEGDSSGP